MSKKVLLSGFEGFFLAVSMSSEERLMVTLDVTDMAWDDYRNFIYELQDVLGYIDDTFNERASRGRRLRARHRKHLDKREKFLRFSPFPSSYSTVLKRMRAEVYRLVNMYCITLQSIYEENVKRNVYLLPKDNAKNLLTGFEKINGEIGKLNKDIEKYLRSSYYDQVIKILEKYDMLEQARWLVDDPYKKFRLDRMRVTMLPVSINPSIVEEWARVSPEVAKALEDTRRKVVKNIVERDLNEIKQIINILREKKLRKKMKPEYVKRQLEALREKTESIGLSELSRDITRLINLVDKPIHSFELTKLEKTIDARIETLI